MKQQSKQPTNLELQILSLLWEHGQLTVREVLESLPDKKDRAYTSVLSVMQVMEKRGFLKRKRAGKADLWLPKQERPVVMGEFLRGVVTKFFSGSASLTMQQFLEGVAVDEKELDALESLLKEM